MGVEAKIQSRFVEQVEIDWRFGLQVRVRLLAALKQRGWKGGESETLKMSSQKSHLRLNCECLAYDAFHDEM